MFHRAGAQPRFRNGRDDGVEVVDLHSEVAESAADDYRSVRWPVHKLERDQLLIGELEHSEGDSTAEINPTDLLVSKSAIEIQRSGQVSDAIRRMQSLHTQTVSDVETARRGRKPWRCLGRGALCAEAIGPTEPVREETEITPVV